MKTLHKPRGVAPVWALLALITASIPAWSAAPPDGPAAPARERQILDRIVAVVNDDVITATELDERIHFLELQLRQQRKPVPPRDRLRGQVLEHMVMDRIQLQLAAATGIRVDDETLNKTLAKIAAQNHLSLAEFHDVLEQEGFSFARFREDMRKEIIKQRLQQREVDSRIVVTDQEVDNFLVTQRVQGKVDEEYRLGHILVAIPGSATPEDIHRARQRAQEILDALRGGKDFAETAIESSDGQQALKGGDLGWRKAGELPTLFVDVVQSMQVGDISDLIRSPSGFHIVKLLDKRSGARHVITQTRARHILIKPGALLDEQAALARARELRRRLLAGEDFAALAREYSDDKATATQGGELGWVDPGQMVPEFQRAMDALEPGEISEPVKSGFGWHLIQVEARRSHDDTEEHRRKLARQQIFRRKAEEARSSWLRRLRDEAYVEYRL